MAKVVTIFGSRKEEYRRSLHASKLLVTPTLIKFNQNGTLHIGNKYILIASRNFDSLDILASGSGQNLKFGWGENTNIPFMSSFRFDPHGNLLALSASCGVIIKVTPKGQVLSWAGGIKCDPGTVAVDGPISTAKFANPYDLLVDDDQNVYVCEGFYHNTNVGGNRLRIITKNGVVSTIAGGAGLGFRDGPWNVALFNNPCGIEFDLDGNILIADAGNHAIRIFDITSRIVSTIVGFKGKGFRDGDLLEGKLNSPLRLTIDKEGKIFISDNGNHAIRVIDLKLKTISTIVGDGLPGFFDGIGKNAQLFSPMDLTFDETYENLLIADSENSAIRNYKVKSTYVSTLIEREGQGIDDGYGGNAQFMFPVDLAMDEADNIYVSDSYNNVIRKVTPENIVSTYAGFSGVSGYQDGQSNIALFYHPRGITFYKNDLYIMDNGNGRIRKVDSSHNVSTIAGSGTPGYSQGYGQDASFTEIIRAVVDSDIGVLYFSAAGDNRILRLNLTSHYVEAYVGNGNRGYYNGYRLDAWLQGPNGVCLDLNKNLYFFDEYSAIRMINKSDMVTLFAGDPQGKGGGFVDGVGNKAKFFAAQQLSCTSNDTMFVADMWNSVIRRVDLHSGAVTTVAGTRTVDNTGNRGGLNKSAKFYSPQGITVSSLGQVYIADTSNKVIKKLDVKTGRVTSIAGFGAPKYPINATKVVELIDPRGLAIHPITNEIFLADTDNNLILRFDRDVMKIHAGLGSIGWFDNETNLRDSEFNNPWSIAFSSNGSRLIVADTYNHVIREITSFGVKTIAGIGDPGAKTGAAMSSAFNLPKDVIFDKNGNIYVSDTLNHVIKKISNNTVSIVAGNGKPAFLDGKALFAQFNCPIGLAFDKEENLVIADSLNHAIRLLNFKSANITTIAGVGEPGFIDGTGNTTYFKNPTSVALADHHRLILVLDSGNHAIRVINVSDPRFVNVKTLLGVSGEAGYVDGSRESVKFKRPANMKVDLEGNLIILDAGNHALRKFDLQKYLYPTISAGVSDHSTGYLNVFQVFLISMSSIFCVSVIFALYYRMYYRKKYSEISMFISNRTREGTFQILTRGNTQNSIIPLSNVERLQTFGKKDPEPGEMSKTVSISRSVAVAVPGHLLVNNFENLFDLDPIKETGPEGMGATAVVQKGSIIDAALVQRYGFSEIAVKVIRGDMSDTQLFESFRYEVSIMATLPDSPYLIKLIGYCESPMAIIMKYYKLSLLQLMNSQEFKSHHEAKLKCARDVAMGMQLVHSKNIIHFDLKPANILVDYQSEVEYTFVICDFGFADFTSEAGRQFVAGMKKPQMGGITPRYAAPELYAKFMKRSQNTDKFKKVDVYAYAMVLYQIWTGRKPWDTLRIQEIEVNVLSDVRPDLSDVEQNMRSLIKKCWHENPDVRPSFDEILKQII